MRKCLDRLSAQEQAEAEESFMLLREFGILLGMPHARPVTGHSPLWELRPGARRIFTLRTLDGNSSCYMLFANRAKRHRHKKFASQRSDWPNSWRKPVSPLVDLEAWEAERMRDPAFVAALAERQPAYQVARLRILRGLTQEQLAEMVGTKQSSIARLEQGKTPPSLSFLRKVADALGARVEVQLTPIDETGHAMM